MLTIYDERDDMDLVGFGVPNAVIAVYVENKPPLIGYHQLDSFAPLKGGEIEFINQQAGNGWRKQFNVFAKLIAALNHPSYAHTQTSPWQQYRDTHLLQSTGLEAYLFSSPNLSHSQFKIHLIAGRTYAKSLLCGSLQNINLIWLDEEFAIDPQSKLIVCPFFDYRQLSNVKIDRLCQLIKEMTVI